MQTYLGWSGLMVAAKASRTGTGRDQAKMYQHHVSIAPLGPPAVVGFRVLQRTEPLLRPAPPKGRVARRVEWRRTLPWDPNHGPVGKSPEGLPIL
jgi:hypothetical protein